MNRNPFRNAALPLALALSVTANIGLAGDGYKTAPGPEAVGKLFGKMVSAEECAPIDSHTCGESCETGWKAGKTLAGMIVKDEASFHAFAPLFVEQFESAETSDHGRTRLLGFLAGASCKNSAALGEKLFASSPESFEEGTLVSFASMGSKTFKGELKHRVVEDRAETVLPAAYLAFQGYDVGKPALEQAMQADLTLTTVDDALVAAAALDSLAGESKAGAEAQVLTRVHDSVIASLDRGDLQGARELALAAKLVTKKLAHQKAGGYGFGLNNLQTEVAWYLRTDAKKLVSAEQVFEVIEEITPIS